MSNPIAIMQTSKGEIWIELDRTKAPISVDNFIADAKAGHYDGTVFHRVIRGFMIQGGGMTADMAQNNHVFSAATAEHIRAAFEALCFLRLRQEITLLEAGQPSSHYLNPSLLSKTEQDLLREAFQAVSKLQDATKRYFSRTPF